ncbi:hypothetical protein [Kaistia algarum]|uniref:hypothetical protein n=1 Tax=Kaistia algarum TaxID=2083279 RepID=UPI0010575398|nr:hypothetical protein [Kaistia algarum]MCX5512493.1 hypothetical protein [Kaistia algarum]
MRHRRSRGWSVEVALTVALFLVVQAFFSGLSIGARADTLGSAGEVLCLGSRSLSAETPSSPSDRDHLADCCTLGCPMLGGLPAPQAAAASVPPVLAGLAARASHEAHQPGRFELSPLHSRAPPEA